MMQRVGELPASLGLAVQWPLSFFPRFLPFPWGSDFFFFFASTRCQSSVPLLRSPDYSTSSGACPLRRGSTNTTRILFRPYIIFFCQHSSPPRLFTPPHSHPTSAFCLTIATSVAFPPDSQTAPNNRQSRPPRLVLTRLRPPLSPSPTRPACPPDNRLSITHAPFWLCGFRCFRPGTRSPRDRVLLGTPRHTDFPRRRRSTRETLHT